MTHTETRSSLDPLAKRIADLISSHDDVREVYYLRNKEEVTIVIVTDHARGSHFIELAKNAENIVERRKRNNLRSGQPLESTSKCCRDFHIETARTVMGEHFYDLLKRALVIASPLVVDVYVVPPDWRQPYPPLRRSLSYPNPDFLNVVIRATAV